MSVDQVQRVNVAEVLQLLFHTFSWYFLLQLLDEPEIIRNVLSHDGMKLDCSIELQVRELF